MVPSANMNPWISAEENIVSVRRGDYGNEWIYDGEYLMDIVFLLVCVEC